MSAQERILPPQATASWYMLGTCGNSTVAAFAGTAATIMVAVPRGSSREAAGKLGGILMGRW
ncbi:hypothetical protein JMUB6875_11000 [Nocardia sp. JMUB6875]